MWNSVGIAQAMDDFVKEENLENFSREHLEILQGCLYLTLKNTDAETWEKIYENLKNFIFLALTESELCSLASDILQKIFFFEEIQKTVLVSSKKIFLKLLKLVYHPDVE